MRADGLLLRLTSGTWSGRLSLTRSRGYLTYSGYDVTRIVNITDVDDKLINKANDLGRDVTDLAKEMTEDYFDNRS